jgi:flagellar biosynthesis component FlhA
MAKYNLDNFPQPQTKWADWQKVLAIALTAGLGFIIWRLITEANEARKIAQAKIAESYEKLKAAELEKAVTEKVVEQTMGQGMLNHIQEKAKAELLKDEKPPNTDGSVPFVEVPD